jgi:hypothetical protein
MKEISALWKLFKIWSYGKEFARWMLRCSASCSGKVGAGVLSARGERTERRQPGTAVETPVFQQLMSDLWQKRSLERG